MMKMCCPICKKAYVRKAALFKHLQKHEPNSDFMILPSGEVRAIRWKMLEGYFCIETPEVARRMAVAGWFAGIRNVKDGKGSGLE